ncbi:DUF5753 domain-containing protein [Streptomyces sp. VTCC 41912]|uniref:DUF5753 domain-containing protein n=1 Tax=Streptomyces sp. VTCC 41912 TaxID=3383243 RepID=UPI00389687EB
MHDDVIRSLRAPDQTEMGRVAGGMGAEATARLAALDAAAETIRAWYPLLVPGLLQTGPYAAAAIRSRTPSLPAEEVARRVESRVQRAQEFLRRWSGEEGPYAWFIVGEAALTQPVATMDVHEHQVAHLLGIMERYPRVIVQVLPDDASVAGNAEPFSVHALSGGPRVGHVETVIGGWYTVVPEDITRLYAAFSTLGRWALSPSETRKAVMAWLTHCGAPGAPGTVPSS